MMGGSSSSLSGDDLALSGGWAQTWRGTWPLMMGVAAIVSAFAMLGCSAFFFNQANDLRATGALPVGDSLVPVTTSPAESAERFLSQFPVQVTHLDDIAYILNVAQDQGLAIGHVNYQVATGDSVPVVIRSIEIHLEEEYPKLKFFAAQLLREMPHLYLDEIRVEQASAAGPSPATKVQASLKLSLIYRSTPMTARNSR